jgi:hypothetical protein
MFVGLMHASSHANVARRLLERYKARCKHQEKIQKAYLKACFSALCGLLHVSIGLHRVSLGVAFPPSLRSLWRRPYGINAAYAITHQRNMVL